MDAHSNLAGDLGAKQAAEPDRTQRRATPKEETSDKTARYEDFFRVAYAGCLHFLSRVPSTSGVPSVGSAPMLLAKAFNEVSEGLAQVEEPAYRQLSLRPGRVIEVEAVSLAEKREQAKKYLQGFYQELKKSTGEPEGGSLRYREDYEAFLYRLALGVPPVPADRATQRPSEYEEGTGAIGNAAMSPDVVRAKVRLYDELCRYSNYFRKAASEAPRFRQWWHDLEITTFGSRQQPSISEALEQARNRAKVGLDKTEGAIAAISWSFEALQEDELLLDALMEGQENDTEENVMVPLIAFNKGLQRHEGLARYKEEYGRFMSDLASLRPLMKHSEADPFPDPHGPTELEEQHADLKEKHAELRKENQELKERLSELHGEHRTLEREHWRLAEELQALRATQEFQALRATQELRAASTPDPALTELNTTMKRIEEKEDERERHARWRKALYPNEPWRW